MPFRLVLERVLARSEEKEMVGTASSVDSGEVGFSADFAVSNVQSLLVALLHLLDSSSKLLIVKSQDLGSSKTSTFRLENEHRTNSTGHTNGREEISSTVSAAVGRANDYRRHNIGISKTTKSIRTASNSNVNLRLRSSLVTL